MRWRRDYLCLQARPHESATSLHEPETRATWIGVPKTTAGIVRALRPAAWLAMTKLGRAGWCRGRFARSARGAACLSPKTGLGCPVRVIALRTIKKFVGSRPEHRDAREPALAWYRQVLRADRASPAAMKREIGSASILKDGRVVFDIAGNKYRIVVWINYPCRVMYIRFIGTHICPVDF